MKVTIRKGMFETNSSSTHTCILTSQKSFEDWEKGYTAYYTGYSEQIPDYLKDDSNDVYIRGNVDLKKTDGFIMLEDIIVLGSPLDLLIDDIENNRLEDDLQEEIDNWLEESDFSDIYEYLYYEYNLLLSKTELALESDIIIKEINGQKIVAKCYYGNDW